MTRAEMLKNIFAEGKGTSGDTATAMLRYMKIVGPLLLLWENVAELIVEHNDQNLQDLLDAIDEAGYVCAFTPCGAYDYYCIAERRRALGLCLNIRKSKMSKKDAQVWVNKVADMAKQLAFAHSRRAVNDVILDNEHW